MNFKIFVIILSIILTEANEMEKETNSEVAALKNKIKLLEVMSAIVSEFNIINKSSTSDETEKISLNKKSFRRIFIGKRLLRYLFEKKE